METAYAIPIFVLSMIGGAIATFALSGVIMHFLLKGLDLWSVRWGLPWQLYNIESYNFYTIIRALCSRVRTEINTIKKDREVE